MKNFKEIQMFTQWYIWMFFLGILILTNYAQTIQMIENDETIGVILKSSIKLSIIPLIIILLFLVMRLKTSINENSVQVHFFPLTQKKIRWKDVKEAKIITYNPYRLLGRGIRSSSKYGTVYNISGSKGLLIKLKNGQKNLIGTQKVDELKKYLTEIDVPFS